MSIGFQLVHGSTVIILQKTVYKQVAAYSRDKEVYAKACGGYIKLKINGGTTHPDVRWLEVDGVKGCRKPKETHGYVEVKS